MRSYTARLVLASVTAAVALASEGFAQAIPEGYSITHINGGVYRALNNNHGTVFLVTPEGIVLADPVNTDFAVWLKREFDERFGVPVRYVIYSHYHWDHASGGDVFSETAQYVGHENMLSHLAMPPASTTLSEVLGQYAPVAALDANGNGVIEESEIGPDFRRYPGSEKSQFVGFDANEDGVLSGAEVKRGPISFVRAPNITYADELEITLGGKRVNMTWVGEMNHSMDSSLITFPDDSVMYVVDYVTFGRVPNREMDYELLPGTARAAHRPVGAHRTRAKPAPLQVGGRPAARVRGPVPYPVGPRRTRHPVAARRRVGPPWHRREGRRGRARGLRALRAARPGRPAAGRGDGRPGAAREHPRALPALARGRHPD